MTHETTNAHIKLILHKSTNYKKLDHDARRFKNGLQFLKSI